MGFILSRLEPLCSREKRVMGNRSLSILFRLVNRWDGPGSSRRISGILMRATEACTAICLSGIMLQQHRDDGLTLSNELFKRTTEIIVRRLQAARGKLISRR